MIGLAGPVWGLAAAAFCFGVWLITKSHAWAAIAAVGAWVNLFNLLPVWQLDGGRGFRALSTMQRWIVVAAMGAMVAVSQELFHEFEGLLFSNCDAFDKGIGRTDLIPAFQEIRGEFSTPEEINDSPVTAPSKRVEKLVEGYEKPLHGTLAVLEIGLETIRGECPHFRAWLAQLAAAAK